MPSETSRDANDGTRGTPAERCGCIRAAPVAPWPAACGACCVVAALRAGGACVCACCAAARAAAASLTAAARPSGWVGSSCSASSATRAELRNHRACAPAAGLALCTAKSQERQRYARSSQQTKRALAWARDRRRRQSAKRPRREKVTRKPADMGVISPPAAGRAQPSCGCGGESRKSRTGAHLRANVAVRPLRLCCGQRLERHADVLLQNLVAGVHAAQATPRQPRSA